MFGLAPYLIAQVVKKYLSAVRALHNLKDISNFIADHLIDISIEWDDKNDEVVHGSTYGKGLGMIVQAVVAREIDNKDILVDLIGLWRFGVVEQSSLAFYSPDFFQQSCFSCVSKITVTIN